MSLDSEHGTGFERPVEPDKNPNTNKRKVLLAVGGVALVLTAFMAGRGAGGEQVSATPVPTAEQPAEAPVFDEDEVVSEVDVAPAEEVAPADTDPIVTIEKPVNPMGLEDMTYEEILALGTPIEILSGSEEDTTQEVADKFAKALMVWLNIDSSARANEYEEYLFGGANVAENPVVEPSDIFDPVATNEFYSAKSTFDPEIARDLTMEVGVQIVTNKEEAKSNSYQHNIPRMDDPEVGTFYVKLADIDIQYGTRAAGDELTDQSIGVDYRVVKLKDAQFHLDGIRYLDQNNQEQVAKVWRLGTFKEAVHPE